MEATYMSISRWMDKEDVMHTYSGILLSYKKGHMWISSNDMDEPTAYYTEWSKSEREKQISYINTYIWNLERWYWGTYLQDSKEDADIENRLLNTEGEGKGGINWESSTETYITICKIDRGNLLYDSGSSNPVLFDNLVRWDGVGGRLKKERTYVYLWLIHLDVWQKPTQHCKAIILQLKINKF